MKGEIVYDSPVKRNSLKTHLDALYRRLNRRKYVSPDPLQFLYDYSDPFDREIVGLVASSLAYGRVAQILASVSKVLAKMPKPREFLEGTNRSKLERAFGGFKHRFTTGDELAAMLDGARLVIKRHGSLGDCFTSHVVDEDETVLPALSGFVSELCDAAGGDAASLLPAPSRGSACKRLNMYLRWMVRSDEVDPGCWKGVPTSKLVVPLDTHMYNICKGLGFTRRKAADMKTALEITEALREMAPKDPVRYDFAITRLGIRSEMDPSSLLSLCK